MPLLCNLVEVTKEGYFVKAEADNLPVLIRHEQVAAIFSGLIEREDRMKEAYNNEVIEVTEMYQLCHAVRQAMPQRARRAWRLGPCSWNMDFVPINYDANPFHQSD